MTTKKLQKNQTVGKSPAAAKREASVAARKARAAKRAPVHPQSPPQRPRYAGGVLRWTADINVYREGSAARASAVLLADKPMTRADWLAAGANATTVGHALRMGYVTEELPKANAT